MIWATPNLKQSTKVEHTKYSIKDERSAFVQTAHRFSLTRGLYPRPSFQGPQDTVTMGVGVTLISEEISFQNANVMKEKAHFLGPNSWHCLIEDSGAHKHYKC